MMNQFEKTHSAASFIKDRWQKKPKVGMVLGTGLGGVSKKIQVEHEIPYEQVPHFPRSTAPGHHGRLICGTLEGVPVVAMDGRFHAYEGYGLDEITLPVRVFQAIGCEFLFVSNACGGMNPLFKKGDIMLINDHINLLGGNPLIGPNDDRLGVRFPDMSEPYDQKLLELASRVALENKVKIQNGVYVAVTGPCLETRAEYRFLKMIGADVVGMSTVPEVIVGVHAGLRILGLSIITDLCLPDALEPVSVEEIISVAKGAEEGLSRLVCGLLKQLETI
jgi:purine-nucleoside phosphorylase